MAPTRETIALALIKTTPIRWREGLKLQFRAEFYEASNTPQFSNPDVAVSDGPAFGQVSTTSVNPQIIQLALKVDY